MKNKKSSTNKRISSPITDLLYNIFGIFLIATAIASFLGLVNSLLGVGCLIFGIICIAASIQNSIRRKRAKENLQKLNAKELIEFYKHNSNE